MKLYVWELEGYGPGEIIVMANSLDEAREKATEELDEVVQNIASELFNKWEAQETYIEEKRALYLGDLGQEPYEPIDGVCLVAY